MPSFLSLPAELIDKIITTATRSEGDDDSDEPDPELISSCGLVCKTFYRIARGLQFNAVSCTLTEDNARILPEILTYQHKDLSLPPLVHCVRELDLKFDIAQHAFDEGYLHHLDAFLAPFSGDVCRIRYFTFGAGKDRDETQIIHPTTVSWHKLLPSTQRTFSNIFHSSSLETVTIHGVLNLPFRLLRSITPNVKSLSLTSASVAIDPGDLDESKEQVSSPPLALDQLHIGGLEFELVEPPVTSLMETNEADDAGVAFDLALSRLVDLSKLHTFSVLRNLRGALIEGPIPPLEGLFACFSNLRTFRLEFGKCAELYPLPLDKIPSSVASIELCGFTPLPFVTDLEGGVHDQAVFSGIGEPALFPTSIAAASSGNAQLPEVTVTLAIFIHQLKDPQIETLVLADRVTSYWDALLENLRTIPASRIYLSILTGFKIDYVPILLNESRPRPDEWIEEEVYRVFDEHTTDNPDKPIFVHYSCVMHR